MPLHRLLHTVLLGCMLTAWAQAVTAAPTPGDLRPLHTAVAPASQPVIEYDVQHSLLEASPIPRLRVYGNGLVRVHFPVFMKRAGDYEMHLSPVQLADLLRAFADNGMMDFDMAAARQERKQLETARRGATGMDFHVSDDTYTDIRVRLDRFQRSAGTPVLRNLDRHFRWANLKTDAGRFPRLTRLTNAAGIVDALDELCHHPALRKLP